MFVALELGVAKTFLKKISFENDNLIPHIGLESQLLNIFL